MGSPIVNKVAFDVFADIGCGRPDITSRDSDFLISQVMTAIHHAIVAGARVAVGFPEMKEGALGTTLRVLGSQDDVAKVLATPMIHGMSLAGMLKVSPPKSIPSTTEGTVHARVRIEKFSEGGLDRLDRRTNKRRKIGKCTMEVEDIRNRRKAFLEKGKEVGNLPTVTVTSQSTGERFPLFMTNRNSPIEGNGFNAYGLSTGKAAIPKF